MSATVNDTVLRATELTSTVAVFETCVAPEPPSFPVIVMVGAGVWCRRNGPADGQVVLCVGAVLSRTTVRPGLPASPGAVVLPWVSVAVASIVYVPSGRPARRKSLLFWPQGGVSTTFEPSDTVIAHLWMPAPGDVAATRSVVAAVT